MFAMCYRLKNYFGHKNILLNNTTIIYDSDGSLFIMNYTSRERHTISPVKSTTASTVNVINVMSVVINNEKK